MKVKYCYLFLIIFAMSDCLAQKKSNNFEVGIAYTPLPDAENFDYKGEPFTTWDHFLDIHSKFWINRSIGISAKFLYIILDTNLDIPPYYLYGISPDIRIFRDKNFEACSEIGLSYANLIKLVNDKNLRQNTFNISFGLNLDYRFYEVFWVQLGYNAHYSLDSDIKNKDTISQPYIGLAVKF